MDGCAVPRRRSGKRGSHLGRRICRQFVNGSCRFGPHCSYLHEYPAVPLVQVCRYFQKGGCWFGENCRYLHIAGPDSGASGARRGSAPVVNASLPGHVSADRRGSEPSLNAPGAYNWRRASEPLVTSLSYQQTSQRPTTGIAEEEEHAVLEAGSILPQQEEGLQPQESDGLGPHLPSNSADEVTVNAASGQEKTDSKTDQQAVPLLESGATASVDQGQSEAYNQSKDVFCGICMDKVYEKGTVRERRFGILPNCSHAFCLSCIMTWRKTKDFQEEVIKACPQCRVKSPFYIPSKYWVCEGEPKEALIASFKEKSSLMNKAAGKVSLTFKKVPTLDSWSLAKQQQWKPCGQSYTQITPYADTTIELLYLMQLDGDKAFKCLAFAVSKIKCNFFMRHGCCPFASECIFSHELPPGHRLHRRCFRPKNALELLEDMDDENQRLLSYLIALTLLDDEDFDFIQFELV